MMAAQLLGSGGIAALLLLGAAAGVDSVIDLSLALALLAAFATVAFVKFAASPPSGEAGPDDAL
jgi:multicomponent Na+:H+ antiporter subunit F